MRDDQKQRLTKVLKKSSLWEISLVVKSLSDEGVIHQEIALAAGKSRPWVTRLLLLHNRNKVCDEWRQLVIEDILPFFVVVEMVCYYNKREQKALAAKIRCGEVNLKRLKLEISNRKHKNSVRVGVGRVINEIERLGEVEGSDDFRRGQIAVLRDLSAEIIEKPFCSLTQRELEVKPLVRKLVGKGKSMASKQEATVASAEVASVTGKGSTGMSLTGKGSEEKDSKETSKPIRLSESVDFSSLVPLLSPILHELQEGLQKFTAVVEYINVLQYSLEEITRKRKMLDDEEGTVLAKMQDLKEEADKNYHENVLVKAVMDSLIKK